MTETPPESGSTVPLTIRRARLDSLDLYELTDEELGTLERGSPASLQLNFSLVFLTSGLSFLVTLLTATFPSERTFQVFVLSTVSFVAVGVVLFGLWWRNRGDVQRVIERIRGRLGRAKAVEVALPRSADSRADR